MRAIKQFTALVFSFLIVCMPVVFAAQIQILNISGTDEVRNFYKRNDQIKLSVLATLEGDAAIDQTQLALFLNNQFYSTFDTCDSVQENISTCTLQKSAPQPRLYTAEVRLYDDLGKSLRNNPLTRTSEQLTADLLPGFLSSLTVPNQVINQPITIEGAAEDRAFTISEASRCSGVKEVIFYLDSITSAPIHRIDGNNRCFFPFNTQYTPSNVPDGVHNLLVVVKDRFNQFRSPPQSYPIIFDSHPPEVSSSQILLRDSESGNAYAFISSRGNRVNIEVPITDPLLVSSDLKADFSMMTSEPMSNIPLSSYSNGIATWLNIPTNGFRSCSMIIKARDTAGNSANITANCNVTLDNTSPVPSSLITSGYEANRTLIASKGDIKIRFSESGVGMSQAFAYLDLLEIGGKPNTRASECNKLDNGEWECIWSYSNPRITGERVIRLLPTTSDDLGNTAQLRSYPVLADITSPSVKNFDYMIFGSANSSAVVPIKGSRIAFMLNSSGFNPSKVSLDLSRIGGPAILPMSCTGTSCSKEYVIEMDGPFTSQVFANISDNAGNKINPSLEITVAAVDTTSPDYWMTNVKCAPSVLDRSIGPLIEQRVYCDANLQSPNPIAVPIQIVFGGPSTCTGDTKYFTNLETLNILPLSTHPTFALTLQATEFKVNSLKLSCPIQITTMFNATGGISVNPSPEIKNISMEIKFFDQPFGDAFKSQDDQINKAVKDAKDNLKIIGTLSKFLGYAEKACNAYQMFQNMMAMFKSLTYLFGKQAQATAAFPGVHDKFVQMRNTLCGIDKRLSEREQGTGKNDGLMGFFQKMCAFVNCRLESDPGSEDVGLLEKIGGGAPHCRSIKEKLASIGGAGGVKVPAINEQKYTWVGGNPNTIDVRDNLIMSSVCLCVPGIIRNLNKYREIKCRHALCLLQDVKEKGVPVGFCDEMKSYETCNFVVGDIFRLFPIVTLFDSALSIVKEMFANPFQILAAYSALKCQDFCQSLYPEQYQGCVTPMILAKLGDAINNIRRAKDILNGFKTGGDSCDKLEKLTKEEKK